MVRRLVDEQSAAVAFVAVPAAEIVGAVRRVEQPLEMDARDVADRAGSDQLAHFGVVRRVAVVERHAQVPAGTLDGVENRLAFLLVDGHRLFGDDVAAEFHRADDVMVMRPVDGGDDDGVGFRLANHVVEPVRRIGRNGRMAVFGLKQSVRVVEPHGIDVAKGDELSRVAEVAGEGAVEKLGAAAGADERVAFDRHADDLPRHGRFGFSIGQTVQKI